MTEIENQSVNETNSHIEIQKKKLISEKNNILQNKHLKSTKERELKSKFNVNILGSLSKGIPNAFRWDFRPGLRNPINHILSAGLF